MKNPDWSRFIKDLFQIAAPYLTARGDVIHSRVSHSYALILMQHEGGDKKIVEPAIILHDVGWSTLDPQQIEAAYGVRAEGDEAERLNRKHELEGASIARQILQDLDYDQGLIDNISLIIQRHDSGSQIDCLEEALVKDADKLWRFSETGFWDEIKRQGLGRRELHQYLDERYKSWFFTQTALRLAGEELEERAKEIATHGKEHPLAGNNGYKGQGIRKCERVDH
jgi:CRISPR/Cas system-associated endonuclease Cas3-HD